MRKLLLALFLGCTLLSFGQSLQKLYQEGIKAYDNENFEAFRDNMHEINKMRPNYPAVVYNLACGYALTGQHDMAIATLKSYILMDATKNLSEDSDLKSLREKSKFLETQEWQKQFSKELPITLKYEWNILSSHPESITYSKRLRSFFVGGVRDGIIWKIDKNGVPSIFSTPPINSWSVMGLAVDTDERYLWVCTTSMYQFEDYNQNEKGYASVLKYDIKNGDLLETIALPGGHNFGDLIINELGDVFVSDGMANKIYTIKKDGKELEEFMDLSEKVYNIQGLTFDQDENVIYFSDYIDGIYRLSLKDKALTKLLVNVEDVLLKGIDGLYFENNTLIGMHNGTKPNRIVRYHLSGDGKEIVKKETLAQAGTLGEPTQGVFVGDSFFFISNSPWGSYDENYEFDPKEKAVEIGTIN